MIFVTDIKSTEYLSFYKPYIDKAGELELIEALNQGLQNTYSFFNEIDENKLSYRYQPNKWTVKEILQHLIDAERVFTYRALRFARKDKTNLPGYDENFYVSNCNGDTRSIKDLVKEYKALRCSTISLFESFTNDILSCSGFANNAEMSVRAIGFVIVGHEKHHIEVIKERYL